MPSAVISSYVYDREKSVLRVSFVSGLIYEYTGVPESLYIEMKNSFSKGVFLNKKIKGKYQYRKVE
jgi:hypothetical protein